MKKIAIIAVLSAIGSLANATTINAPSSLIGSSVLVGENAYAWGIPISLGAGQSISSASISFSGITLTGANSSGTGYLYTDLLNSGTAGVTAYADGDAPGDYFLTKFTSANLVSLGYQFFASVGTTLSWTYNLNSTQLAALNSFLADGIFSITIDPDCHYTVGGLSFTYATTTTNVPDVAATIYLLGVVLLGVEVSRRKLALAK